MNEMSAILILLRESEQQWGVLLVSSLNHKWHKLNRSNLLFLSFFLFSYMKELGKFIFLFSQEWQEHQL